MWRFLTDFGDTAVTVPLALLMAGFLVAAKQPRLALGWSLAILGCAGAIAALKLAFTACGAPLAGPVLSSPSGHTAMSTAVYGGFAAVIGAAVGQPARRAVVVGAAVLLIGIAVSRTVLRYHSPIEVAVGLVVGAAALAAIVASVARHRPGELRVGWLFAAALALAFLFHGERWPAEQALRHFSAWIDIARPWCG